ncbi:hypothetical protein BKA70DRAFT_1554409 [Coprinopsis sp. MPI-PUGE-AT-0042]|nr:hypothetical protein BKA70DRAFT_1554409 [Coprinopsis sp. MPI-PUGE-AT-0042]
MPGLFNNSPLTRRKLEKRNGGSEGEGEEEGGSDSSENLEGEGIEIDEDGEEEPKRIIKSPTGIFVIMPNFTGTNHRVQIVDGPWKSRWEGGADRSSIEGTQTYGSGYPDQPGRGVSGKDSPLPSGQSCGTIGLTTTIPTTSPPMIPFSFLAPPDPGPQIYHVIADKASIRLIVPRIRRCASGPQSPFGCLMLGFYSYETDRPFAEEAVQYYRGSSAALAIEGYNNTALWGEEGTPDIPVPGNYSKLECLKSLMSQELALVAGPASLISADPSPPEAGGVNRQAKLVYSLLQLRYYCPSCKLL